ncbi:protein phosphatase 1 regulatory subunit 3C [Polymixia lowei]
MNCTKVLHAFGGHLRPSVMPADLVTHLCLTQGQPLYQPLAASPLNLTKPIDCPLRPGLTSPQRTSSSASSSSCSSPESSEPRSCFRRDGGTLSRKRVVFADAKGLALTAVRLFVPEPSTPPATALTSPSPVKPQGQHSPSAKGQRYRLRLGFPQPMLDFKAFFMRLKESLVQLETCSVTEHSLSGTVRVCNVSFEKAVHVRVTFDSWRSYRDVPCTYLAPRYGGSDTDTFAFDAALPQNLDPKERVEFRVSFRAGAGTAPLWDDNRGQNYRVCVETDGSSANQGLTIRRSSTHAVQQMPSRSSCSSPNVKNSADLPSEKVIKQSRGRLDRQTHKQIVNDYLLANYLSTGSCGYVNLLPMPY